MRERLAIHIEEPACKGCHQQMDPIGFGLEHYDPVGAWRDEDNGLPVDAVTELDGTAFEGGVELGRLIAELDTVGECIARRFYQHATTHLDGAAERELVDALVKSFVAGHYDFKALIVEMVVNDGFRYLSAQEEE